MDEGKAAYLKDDIKMTLNKSEVFRRYASWKDKCVDRDRRLKIYRPALLSPMI